VCMSEGGLKRFCGEWGGVIWWRVERVSAESLVVNEIMPRDVSANCT